MRGTIGNMTERRQADSLQARVLGLRRLNRWRILEPLVSRRAYFVAAVVELEGLAIESILGMIEAWIWMILIQRSIKTRLSQLGRSGFEDLVDSLPRTLRVLWYLLVALLLMDQDQAHSSQSYNCRSGVVGMVASGVWPMPSLLAAVGRYSWILKDAPNRWLTLCLWLCL